MRFLYTALAVAVMCAPSYGAYKYTRPVIVPAAHVHGASLSNYVATVVGTYPYLATVTNGGAVLNSSGYDISFSGDSACATPYNFERKIWDATTGAVEFHVQVPTLVNTAENKFYMCYGNASVSSDPSTTAAWDSSYLAVWHLSNGTVLNTGDSTANGNNGTAAGATAGSGQVDGAAILASDAQINVGNTASLQSPTTAVTLSAWVNGSNVDGTQIKILAAQPFASPTNSFPFWSYYLAANDPSCPLNNIAAAWSTGTAPTDHLWVVCSDAANGSRFVPGLWYHVVFTFDGTTGRIYINGEKTAEAVGAGSLEYGGTGDFQIGGGFPGAIDEVTVSNVMRSDSYIATTFDNQLDPKDFYSIGPILVNSTQITHVTVPRPTTTQAVITFTAPSNPASCTLAVSENPSLYPLIPDVDPTIFTGSNLANRDYNVINGNTVTFIVGKRYMAYYATTGNTSMRWSRAAQADTVHSFAINCGGEEYDGTFKTASIMAGDSHPDSIPADPTQPGQPMWQSWPVNYRCNTDDTDCLLHGEQKRAFRTTDVQTGVLLRPLVFPGDSVGINGGLSFMSHRAEAGWTVPSTWGTTFGWVNVDPANNNIYWVNGPLFDFSGAWNGITVTIFGSNNYTISSCSSALVCTLTGPTSFAGRQVAATFQTGTLNAVSSSGSTSKIFATGMQNLGGNGPFNGGYAPYVVPNMLQFNIDASIDDSACVAGNSLEDCKIQFCVSPDQISCSPSAQIYEKPVTDTTQHYVIGSGENMDVLQAAGQPMWSRDQLAILFSPVSCSGSTVTITWNGDTIRPGINIAVGSIVYLDWFPFTVTGVLNDLQFTVASPPGACSNLEYSGFSVAVWKKTTSAHSITVANPFLNVWSVGDSIPQTFAGFISGFHNIPNKINGHNAVTIKTNASVYAIDLVTGDTYPYMSNTGGVVSPTGLAASAFQIDGQGRFWMLGTDGTVSYATYTGDYQRPFIRTGNNSQLTVPLWEGNGGSGLPTCTGTITGRCINTFQLTQSGVGMIQLLNAFDSRYPNSTNFTINPFQTWNVNGLEAGGVNGEVLSIDAQWTGSPGQAYSGWHIIFDPDAKANVNGAFGAGCIGSGNMSDPNYNLPGCVVAARTTWGTVGARWTPDKGSIPVFTSGFSADQGAPVGDDCCAPGSGNVVANIIGTTFTTVTCPPSPPNLISNSVPPTSVPATSCIQLTLDDLPYDNVYGTSSRTFFQTTYTVGDYAFIDSSMPCAGWGGGGCSLGSRPVMAVATVTPGTGTQYILTLACINNNICPTNSPANQLFFWRNLPTAYPPWSVICCSGGSTDAIMWDWVSDPHGSGSVFMNLNGRNGHSFLIGGLWSGIGNGGDGFSPVNQYYTQDYRTLNAAQLRAKYTDPSGNLITGVTSSQSIFNGLAGAQGQEIQYHPNFASVVTAAATPALGVDANPIGGTSNFPPNSDVTAVGSSTYKVSATWVNSNLIPHLKILDLQAISGRRIMRNISAPSAMITDGSGGYYTYCYVFIVGECWSGSALGEVYFNTPNYVSFLNPANTDGGACLDGGFQEATAASNIYLLSDFCIFDAGAWNTHTRYNTGVHDDFGWGRQTLGHILLAGRATIFSDIQGANSVKDSPDHQWYYTPLEFVDNGFFANILVKGPTYIPTGEDTARITFSPIQVSINPPVGANGVGVEIGYEDYGGYCSPNRAEKCVAVDPTMDLVEPWFWEATDAASYTPLSCTHGTPCTIEVPVLWNHVARLTPVYFSGSSIVGRGSVRVIPVQ